MYGGTFAAMGNFGGTGASPAFEPGKRYRPGIDRETDSESDGDGDRLYEGAGGWAAATAGAADSVAAGNGGGGGGGGGGGDRSAGGVLAARSRDVSVRDRIAAVRVRINTFFEEPHSSQGALMFSLLIFLLIVVSSVTLCVETLPHYAAQVEADDYDPLSGPWFVIETVCVVFFTIEFLGRLVSCASYRRFLLSPLNWADFVAILPYYIEVISANGGSKDVDLRIVRLIRLARIFRVFKLSRYSAGLQVTGRAMANSADALTLLIFFTVIAMLIFSAAIYYAERGTWNPTLRRWINRRDEIHAYQSIPDSFFWCITTLTTVGYGNEVPVTVPGKIIAGLTMMAGILIIALPTSVIGANFMQEWKRHQMRMGQISKERERMEFRGRHENVREYRARIVREHAMLCETLREISEFVNYSAHIYDAGTPDPAYAAASSGAADGGPAGAVRAGSNIGGGGHGGGDMGGGAAAGSVARRHGSNVSTVSMDIKVSAEDGQRGDSQYPLRSRSRGALLGDDLHVGHGHGGRLGSGGRGSLAGGSHAGTERTSSRSSTRDHLYGHGTAVVDDLAVRLSASEARLREVELENERLRDAAAIQRGAIPVYGSTGNTGNHIAAERSSSSNLVGPRGALQQQQQYQHSQQQSQQQSQPQSHPATPGGGGGGTVPTYSGIVSPGGVMPRQTFRASVTPSRDAQDRAAEPGGDSMRLPGRADSVSPVRGRAAPGLDQYRPPSPGSVPAINAYGVAVSSAPHVERHGRR
jgi:hypothetical protein